MSAEAVRLMTTGYAAIPGDSIAKYGYGLSIGTTFGTRIWQHGGAINGFDANVTMFPDKRISIVVLDNRSGNPIGGLNTLIAREVAKLVAPAPSEPPAPRAPTAAERAAIAGSYAQGRRRMDFAADGNTLVFRQGSVALPVQMVGTDRITFTPPGGSPTTMILVRDAQGRVAYLHQGLRALARQ
jgi:CubicO group peptidase (beta-lactamase class C family)